MRELAVFVTCATWSMGTTTLSKCGYRSRVTTGGRGEDPARSSSSKLRPSICSLLQVTFGLSFGVFLVLAKSSRGWRKKESMVVGSGEKLDSFFVFVVSLGGSTVQVRVEGSDIPECHWYLTFSGKDLRHVLYVTPLFVCTQDSWVVVLSNPLLESGSVQHVIEEDAGLFVELASGAWHRGQLEASLRFSLSQRDAIRGKGVLWVESLCAVPLNEGHLLLHLVVPVSQMAGPPLPAAIEGSLSHLPIAQMPLRFLNCSKG